jgi:hypothetical protein
MFLRYNKTIWFLIYFLPTIIFILLPAVFIFLIDPLWQWNHPFHIKTWHQSFNERLQKTNYLASRTIKVDTLIVGSSRSSYMDPSKLGSKNSFNYAVSSGTASEFAYYINYVKSRSSIPLKFILVESSFNHALSIDKTYDIPTFYVKNAQDFTKKINNLFSKDALNLAKSVTYKPTYNNYFVHGNNFTSYRYPQRNNFSLQQKEQEILSNLASYKQSVYNSDFDINYSIYLKDIRTAIGNSEFAVYTTPVSKYLLMLLIKENQWGNYKHWLQELVDEFGSVYHFMYPNILTLDDTSFNDAHHPTEATCNLILNAINNRQKSSALDNDYYILLNKRNFNEQLSKIKECFDSLKKDMERYR